MAKNDKIIETVILFSNRAVADKKRREPACSPERRAEINAGSTQKVHDMRSRRLMQRLRDEILTQLMNCDIKHRS